jgi:hypothetical protein
MNGHSRHEPDDLFLTDMLVNPNGSPFSNFLGLQLDVAISRGEGLPPLSRGAMSEVLRANYEESRGIKAYPRGAERDRGDNRGHGDKHSKEECAHCVSQTITEVKYGIVRTAGLIKTLIGWLR